MPERGEKRREKTAGSCRLAVRCLAVGLSLLMLMPTVLPLHAQAASSEKTESVAEKSGANKGKPEKKPGASPTPSPSPGKVAGASDEEAAYAAAEALLEEGRPGAAALAFRALGKYRDAESRSAECWALSRVNMSIAAGVEHTIGIKEDGTMMVCGYLEKKKCNVSRWKDVVSVAAGPEHSVGLKADGTLVAVGLNTGGECHLQDWDHIVAIAAGDARTVGLRADGTVLAKGKNDVGDCEVSDWTDIVAVASGNLHTLGLKADGTVLAVGQNNDGQCDVSDWTVRRQGGRHCRLDGLERYGPM